MGPLHQDLLIKEEKICVISDVMGETKLFGKNEDQELDSGADGTIKVRWDGTVYLLDPQYVAPLKCSYTTLL